MAYVTVQRHGQAEIIIKRSRFIANVAPVRSEAEARGFIERIRAEQSGANHNCFAFKAADAQRMSDDGEPSGTAGRPIFEVLDKQGLSDIVIVATRHFGGILLGAGGLVRAVLDISAANSKPNPRFCSLYQAIASNSSASAVASKSTPAIFSMN